MRIRLPVRPLSVLLLVPALVLAGCGGEAEVTGGQPATATAGAGSERSLAGVCPTTVVIQTNWWPQAEDGVLFQLLGENPTVDAGAKTVVGALVDGGVDTGVELEIRAGGPVKGFQPATALLYADPSITLAGTDLDAAAQVSSSMPVQSVFTPLDLSPVVLMWDPAAHPDFETIADIGRTDTRVLYFQGATYMAYLTGAGVLRRSQVDPGYAGSPDRWVASRGTIVQQGYVTNEVIQYQHELPQWKKPVKYQLVAGSGYPVYSETFAVRSDRKEALAPCLRKLVPAMQRATVAFAAEPEPTNRLISQLVSQYKAPSPYPPDRAAKAVQAMKDDKLLGNGHDTTVGNFDEARVASLLRIVGPIFSAQRTPLRAGLQPSDLATNEFIDPGIGLPG